MNIIKRDSRSMIKELHGEVDRLFKRFLPSASNRNNLIDFAYYGWNPNVDIEDTGNSYVIKVDIPGVNPKNLEVKFHNGIITIKGKTEKSHEEKNKSYLWSERQFGEFSRSFYLPEVKDDDVIEAKYKDGVLCIEMLKAQTSTGQQIEIKS